MYVHAYLCARARVQVGARGRARVSSCVPLHVVCLTPERVRQCCSAAAEVMGSPPWQADSSGRPAGGLPALGFASLHRALFVLRGRRAQGTFRV